MTQEDAREIAEYALPRLLNDLPKKIRAALILKSEDEETMRERLTRKLGYSIQWKASELEAKEKARYL